MEMLVRLARRASAVAVVVTALLTVLALLPAGAQQQGSRDRPLLWQGTAGAAGVSLTINTEPRLLPLEDFIRGDAPQADSEWNSNGIAQARGSSYYPGTSGTGGPGLMCVLMRRPEQNFEPCEQISQGSGQPFPPPYPLTAEAQYPTNQDAQTQDGLAQAHALEDVVWSLASGSDNANAPDPLAPLAEVMTVGAAEARTRQEFQDGTFVVTAESHLEDVTIGGQVNFGSIRAVSVSRANGDDPSETTTTFTVTGASVAGHPVSLSDRGVTVDTEAVGGDQLDQANQELNAFLQERGATIRVIQPTTTQDGKNSSGHAPGLLVNMKVPVTNETGEDLPSVPIPPQVPIPNPDPNTVFRTYVVTFVFGQAGSQAFASNDPFDTGPLGGSGGLTGTIGGNTGQIGGGGDAPSGGTGGGLPSDSGRPSFTGGSSTPPRSSGPLSAPPDPATEEQQPEVAPAEQPGGEDEGDEEVDERLLAALGFGEGDSWLFNPFLLPIALLLFVLTRALPEAARRRLPDQEGT